MTVSPPTMPLHSNSFYCTAAASTLLYCVLPSSLISDLPPYLNFPAPVYWRRRNGAFLYARSVSCLMAGHCIHGLIPSRNAFLAARQARDIMRGKKALVFPPRTGMDAGG